MPTKLLTLCSALALAAATACVPAGNEDEEEFGENSPMAAIQEAGELVVAVPADSPPFSSSVGERSSEVEPEGFVVDIAAELAETLAVDMRFIEASEAEMMDLVGGADPAEIGDQEADIAFPLRAVTFRMYKETSRLEGFDLTTPFLITHQRILAPAESRIRRVADLAGKTVCWPIADPTALPVETVAPDAEVQFEAEPAGCAASLRRGEVDAAMASEIDLIEMLAQLEQSGDAGDFEIVGEQLTTEGYAPYVVRGMATFSSDVFSEAQDDGSWLAAYDRWIAPLTGESATPPDLTLLEAAALYPLEEDEPEA